MVKGRPGLRTYPLELVFGEADVEAAIPGDLLVPALEVMGFRAKVSRGALVTDADFRQVVELVEKLSRAYKRLMDEPISARAKRLVALYMVATGSDVEEAVGELARLGILQMGNVVSLADEYDKALSKLKSVLGGKARHVQGTQGEPREE